eukprot:TRINITY_DN110969_c0_g1_i1.p1 TRINITY_DN110969_c0_g1~~TRINITY_DN110969_c0_g1_i1.p1  ORF type:complete len:561 (+),score=136.29 TRINITY_DN110969_c0_g1_i1:76-1758(+)
MAMRRAAAVATSVGLSAVLTGCGDSGSGGGGGPTAAPTAAPSGAPTAAPSTRGDFKLVSQEFNGNLIVNVEDESLPIPPQKGTGTMYMGLDMETMKMRMDQHLAMDVEAPGIKIHTDETTNYIFDIDTKRYTAYTNTVETGGPKPINVKECIYVETPAVTDAATLKKCIDDATSSFKSASSEGGLKKYEISADSPDPSDPGSFDASFYTDDSGVLKKVTTDLAMEAKGQKMKTHLEMSDDNAKAGAPDGSRFAVPSEWGECQKKDMPVTPISKMPAPLKAFCKCMGLGDATVEPAEKSAFKEPAKKALFLEAGSSLKMVSQVVKGPLTVKQDIPGIPMAPMTGTSYVGLDMERMSARMDEYLAMDMEPVPGMKMHTDTKSFKIFDVSTKRYTGYTETVVTGGPQPITTKMCMYVEAPHLKDAAAVRQCIESFTAGVKPSSTEGGLQKYEISMDSPDPSAPGKFEESLYTDEAGILKKLVGDMTMKVKGQAVTSHVENSYDDTEAGAPDSSVFGVPSEWGECKKQEMPDDPTIVSKLPAPVKAFYHCMGLGEVSAEPSVFM